MMLHQKQRNTCGMKDMVEKLECGGELVMDLCARTFTAAKACMALSRPRRIVGCHVDLS